MRKRKNNIFLGIDWLTVLIYFILVFLGWINIYAASQIDIDTSILDFSTKFGKQLIWIGLSLPLIILILFFDAKFYEKFTSVFYLIAIIALIGLFIFGKKINGASSWYGFGGFSLQPSEFAKAITALAIAKLLSDKHYNLKTIKNQLKAFIIIAIPAILITLQPDPGSAIVYTSFFFVFYREGIPKNYLIIGFLAILLFFFTLSLSLKYILGIVLLLFVLFSFYLLFFNNRVFKKSFLQIAAILIITIAYISSINYTFHNIFEQRHRDRFNIILGKTVDKSGIGYNTDQSIITIASGKVTGKGFLEGDRTKGKFVPEQETDYIFSTVGEEWGFIGSSLVVVLFVILLLRIINLAERQKTKFNRVYGYSVAAILFFHFLINIGMVIGLLPTIGIPLPFFSYGGSALWGFTFLLFIFIKLDANRIYEW